MRRYSYVFIFAALLLALSAAFCAAVAPAAEEQLPEDKYVRLMSAQSVSLLEIDGKSYRKAEGPARFLHNDTWLICDTALWNVDEQVIHAFGHVSIEQDETELRGDSLVYIVQQDLAKFRGHVVELLDKDGNMLRTRNLDYNTKDSIAVFRGGGSMKDNKGQVIESIEGTYESKIKLFTFKDQVDMFTDSVFIKTSLLFYNTKDKLATFPEYVEAWKEDKMLSASSGWYQRDVEKFFFTDKVHTMSEDKEGWCDTLVYKKLEQDVELLGNAQITDSTRQVTSLGGYMHYVDSTSRILLTKDPVVIIKVEDDDAYTRADTIYYWSQKRCKVDSLLVVQARERRKQISVDPVANIRAKAAQELAKKIKEAQENDPNRPPEIPGVKGEKNGGPDNGKIDAGKDVKTDKDIQAGKDKQTPAEASLDSAALARRDSLHRADSLSDSTKVGFLLAIKKVKMYRPKMQLVCDSLVYSDLDSIVRMFKSPVMWNETHQYSSDSLFVVLDSGKVRKANLLSDAFIHIEEEREIYYDQIRSLEVMAYFNDSTKLERFDALGSVTALFYLNEKGKIATANRKECSMMSAEFADGQVRKIAYYETPKSNAYPVAQMKEDEKHLKGFGWIKDQRPRSPFDLTSRVPRVSERNRYAARPKTVFKQTGIYFPGYFARVYKDLARADSLRRAAKAAPAVPPARDSLASGDSLGVKGGEIFAAGALLASRDSLARADSLARVDSLARADSISSLPKIPKGYILVHPDDKDHPGTLGIGHVTLLDTAKRTVNLDSLRLSLYIDTTARRFLLPDSLANDTLRFSSKYPKAVVKDTSERLICLDSVRMSLVIIELTPNEIKKIEAAKVREEKRKASEARRQAAIAKREAKWKALDERDAAKKAAKEAKKAAKEQARQEQLLRNMAAQQAKEILEKERYKAKYLIKLGKSLK